MASAKCVGILGGMGPLATADFFQKLVVNTRASCDEEHIPVFIRSDPTIPSRREAILNGGSSPVPALLQGLESLQAQGAEVVAMPCNTAHYFYPQLEPYARVPFLHMPRETVAQLKRAGVEQACLLATTMTLRAEVYNSLFQEAGINMVLPSPQAQEQLMENVFLGVKQGRHDVESSLLEQEMDRMLHGMGVQIFVLACTELPMLFVQKGFSVPVLDTSVVLARAAIRAAGRQTVPIPGGVYS